MQQIACAGVQADHAHVSCIPITSSRHSCSTCARAGFFVCKLKKMANGKKEGAHADGDEPGSEDEQEPEQALPSSAGDGAPDAAGPVANGKAARKPAKRPSQEAGWRAGTHACWCCLTHAAPS